MLRRGNTCEKAVQWSCHTAASSARTTPQARARCHSHTGATFGLLSRMRPKTKNTYSYFRKKYSSCIFVPGLYPNLYQEIHIYYKNILHFNFWAGFVPKFVPRALHILKKNTPFVHLCGACTHHFITKIKSEVRSVIYLSYLVHRTNLERVC